MSESSLQLTLAVKTYLHTAEAFFSSLQADLLTIMLEGGEETTDPSLNTLLTHNKGMLSILVPAAEANRKKTLLPPCNISRFGKTLMHVLVCKRATAAFHSGKLLAGLKLVLVYGAGGAWAPCGRQRGRLPPPPLAGAAR